MGTRHNLGGGRESIKEEVALLKPPPSSLIMSHPWVLLGDSEQLDQGLGIRRSGTAPKVL